MYTTDRRLLTVREAVKEGLYPNESGLRWLIFHEENNGFRMVVRRIGRRVFIDRDAFYQWVDEQNGYGGN